MIEITCAHCGGRKHFTTGAVNRARARGARLFCGRVCFGLARRVDRSKQDKVTAKAAYDTEYRRLNAARIKARKAAYYQATRDPEKERLIRAKNMHRHVEYCRQPEYRQKKAAYDKRAAIAEYGTFGDSYELLLELEKELVQRATSYERRVQKGYYTRAAQKLRRLKWQTRNKLALPQQL